MENLNAMNKIKLPKTVFLARVWEDALRPLAEKYLSQNWEWTLKVGGKVQEIIREKYPGNEGLEMIKRYMAKSVSRSVSEDEAKGGAVKEEGAGELFFTPGKGKVPPPPQDPFHPPAMISKEVMGIMGKRNWQVEKMEKEYQVFFLVHKNEFEDRKLLPFRKEIWDWMVTCVEG